jgi:hypothetical protein
MFMRKTQGWTWQRWIFVVAIVIAGMLQWRCSAKEEQPLTNLSHLDRLYQPVQIKGVDAAVVRAMSRPPDYEPGPTDDGRLASVQDAARAAVVYLWRAELEADTSAAAKAEALLRFVMQMQGDHGGFVDWLDTELKPIPESAAEEVFSRVNARAIWALGEGIRVLSNYRPQTAEALWQSFRKTYPLLEEAIAGDEPRKDGEWPAWLRDGGAASEMLLGFVGARSTADEDRLTDLIDKLGNALVKTQAGDSTTAPYAAFLTRPGRWIAAGNAQADALAWAGQMLHRLEWFNAGFFESKAFYPYLLEQGLPVSFTMEGQNIVVESASQTPALVRPPVHALLIVYGMTREQRFADYAGAFIAWLLGKNRAAQPIYDASTGRAFDGVDAEGKVLLTSSANATVEALLALLPAETDPVVREAIRAATPNL